MNFVFEISRVDCSMTSYKDDGRAIMNDSVQ